MNEEKKHRFTARIADVEPFTFNTTIEEEKIYQKAVYHVNKLWEKMSADRSNESNSSTKSSSYILAKVALAFAELYYRKTEQLAKQSQLLDDFERDLDKILLGMDERSI